MSQQFGREPRHRRLSRTGDRSLLLRSGRRRARCLAGDRIRPLRRRYRRDAVPVDIRSRHGQPNDPRDGRSAAPIGSSRQGYAPDVRVTNGSPTAARARLPAAMAPSSRSSTLRSRRRDVADNLEARIAHVTGEVAAAAIVRGELLSTSPSWPCRKRSIETSSTGLPIGCSPLWRKPRSGCRAKVSDAACFGREAAHDRPAAIEQGVHRREIVRHDRIGRPRIAGQRAREAGRKTG